MNIDRKLRSTSARLLLAIPAAAIALSLAACSGPARPSADQVAVGYNKIVKEAGQSELYNKDLVQCLSEAMVKSKLSDEDLANIADGKDLQTSKAAQTLLVDVVKKAVSEECKDFVKAQ